MFWPYLILLALSAAAFSFAGGVIMYAWLKSRADLLDVPNERSNHAVPIPRGGGLAVAIALAGFLFVAGTPGLLIWAIIGIAIISFADDLHHIPIKYRLAVHFGAATLCLLAVKDPIFQGLLPLWADHLLATLLLVVYLNFYNFMDGIDGITCTQSISLGIGLMVVAMSAHGVLSGFIVDGAIVAVACVPFLYYNWHPARMFLGDVGSVTLGLTTGFLLFHLSGNGYWEAALILPAYYLVDAGYTLGKRLWKREKIWEAHSQHAYQQAVRHQNPHDAVVWWMVGGNLILIALAVLSTREGFGLPALGLAYTFAAALRWKLTVLRPAPIVLAPVTA